MASKWKLLLSAIITVALFAVLNSRLGSLPPLGKFLDPIKGIWQNALIKDIPESYQLTSDDLVDEVVIVFNDRGVPHIFANNTHDLYFATGYVMAIHRLWQMEFTTQASLGRLSEVVGNRALQFDRYLRKMGMTWGAEKMMESVKEDQDAMEALEAFSKGVNFRIAELAQKNLPFEYKLLDYEPEEWTPLKTVALGMSINRTLSSSTHALRMSHLQAVWGRDAVLKLFAVPPSYSQPIITKDNWNIDVTIPSPPDASFFPTAILDDYLKERNPDLGSNNWAVSIYKSATGEALLATDPHLGLTLPSIWYEMQLNSPGINVYGVSFPGVPVVMMGFNENIAWGNTNTGNKVFDVYEIELDENRKNYFHNGEWKPLTFRIENYGIRDKTPVTDTIWFTHHGPVMYMPGEESFSPDIPVAHAIAWTGHEAGNVIRPLMDINTAKNFYQFREALSKLNSPPQNYVFAATNGDIGMQLNGLWPVRWQHQGMFINNGRDTTYDWKEYIPFRHLPFEHNPDRDFVSSANQEPADPSYPYYLGWHFANPARSNIINSTLAVSNQVRVDDMKALQNNNQSFWADVNLARMLDSVRVYTEQNPEIPIPDDFLMLLDTLAQWDHVNRATSLAPTLFNRWKSEVINLLWKPLVAPLEGYRYTLPGMDVSFRVLWHEQPIDVYTGLFGNSPSTAGLLYTSLQNVINDLAQNHGPASDQWHWWQFNGSTINHLMNVEALNHPRLQIGGSNESPNAISGTNGPSWRMVTRMSKPIQAWGVYPGGQASNPATAGYNAFINDWATANYYKLELFSTREEALAKYEHSIVLKPESDN